MFSLPLNRPFVLLEDSRHGASAGPSWLFTDPVWCETALDGDVPAALARLQNAVDDGNWAAGFLAYEAGLALEARLSAKNQPTNTMMWFGVFSARQHITAQALNDFWAAPKSTAELFEPLHIQLQNIDAQSYAAKADKILEFIRAGDIYQANLTFQAEISTRLDPLELYRRIRASQRVPYAALVHQGNNKWAISFSPELFFAVESDKIITRPMKGTIRRAPLPIEDHAQAMTLQTDAKNRAENLMIVDLLRNDLSRICIPGSVNVTDLYKIETLPTVHSMTSTIAGVLKPDTSIADAIAALFPCGSITGAPKIRAMEIIHDMEHTPRGIYCGSIGYFGQKSACLSVAIRTLIKSATSDLWALGLGAGIVADSIPHDEWSECLLKGRFLSEPMPAFDLFETLKWTPDAGFADLEAHLERLEQSAAYWQFKINVEEIHAAATEFSQLFSAPMRVRVVLSQSGLISWQAQKMEPQFALPVQVVLAPTIMNSKNPFLFHKTTHRAFYDDMRRQCANETGSFECIFRNEKNEITEGSFTSLFIKKEGKIKTPALACGLLPSILRQKLLQSGFCTEAIVSLEDIRSADALYIGNSVRGLIPAVWSEA